MPSPDVFISYSREDQATARRFAEALQREGFNVWWDQTLRTGDAYDHVTEQALRSAKAVVVLWSRTSAASRWVRAEATIADRQRTLMPAMIEPCDRPVMFELTQTAELAHWQGGDDDPAWRAFVSDLRRIEQGTTLQTGIAATARDSSLQPVRAAAPARRRPVIWAAAAVVFLALVAGGAWFLHQLERQRNARQQLIPEISRRVDAGDNAGAFALARQARQYAPDDPLLNSLTPLFSARYAVSSNPEGVEVHVRRYDAGEGDWQYLGRTPLASVELPRTALRWRFEKKGYAPAALANSALAFQNGMGSVQEQKAGELHVELRPESEQPADMVYVPAGPAVPPGQVSSVATVPAFFIQRTEVTNSQYQEFIAAGGYERPSYWSELATHLRTGAQGLQEAMKGFVDSTGHPGPATWELGSYPEGQGDYPVTGVSWFEAAAYARFRGRSLPGYLQWVRAAVPPDDAPASMGASIAPLSNFASSKAAKVASFQGIGLFGTYDLFGNAREWLFNSGKGKESGWLIGGSWEEPAYQYTYTSSASLMDRSRLNGFRTILVSGESRENAALWASLDLTTNKANAASLRPVSDEIYSDYERQFAYQSGPLNATAPERLATTEDWIKERVTIDTGYNGERMAVILFVPRRVAPPYQPILLFSGAQIVWFPDRSENIEPGFLGLPLDYVVKSGRMLVQPVFQGTYERFKSPYNSTDRIRTLREWIERRWDIGRTLDYLASRNDTDTGKASFLGVSFGASTALPLLAVEHRFKTAVLVSGGMPPPGGPASTDVPLMDVPSHVKRIRIPVLMINGRYDSTFPVETAQVPIFNLFGTPAADKKHVVLEYGHGSPPRAKILGEMLGWFDKYLGEVNH